MRKVSKHSVYKIIRDAYLWNETPISGRLIMHMLKAYIEFDHVDELVYIYCLAYLRDTVHT